MATSMRECLTQDVDCDVLLACFYGLKSLDRDVFAELTTRSEPQTVDQIAESVGRDRSTAYRSVQRLVDSGFVQQEQINYDDGGYCHVFRPTNIDRIVADMRRILNEWYVAVDELIDEFDTKYSQFETPSTADDR